ncbi:MAG: type II toxin-antitoxin system VapC family toxin [Bryobacteraceae bacterium]
MDTNALSAFAEGDRSALRAMQAARSFVLPVIVMGEYLFGIRQSVRRKHIESWFQDFLQSVRLLSVDPRTAHFYAEIRIELKSIGKPIPSNDLWIAALARQHDYPILTRDRHFDRITGITVQDW